MEAPGAGDDWFRVYAVALGVFAISEPRQAEGVTSFLVIGSGRAVLFDSGLGAGRISAVVGKLTGICLLDRANGVLFTGDTYYSGEIYLWAPEMDVAGYMASIAKLVRLAPDLKQLLPAPVQVRPLFHPDERPGLSRSAGRPAVCGRRPVASPLAADAARPSMCREARLGEPIACVVNPVRRRRGACSACLQPSPPSLPHRPRSRLIRSRCNGASSRAACGSVSGPCPIARPS